MNRAQEPSAGMNVPSERLVKSRQRVSDHGEVFTPRWLVEDMLALVEDETHRIDSRFLEPACGSGNFLVPILERKLAVARSRYGRSDFEYRHYALFGLMCVYGIELLADNAVECRANLLETFTKTLRLQGDNVFARAAERVLEANIVQGDALEMVTAAGEPIVFPEWGYVGLGKFQRRDFRFDSLTQRSSFQGTLFDQFEDHEVFVPVKTYPPMTPQEIAR